MTDRNAIKNEIQKAYNGYNERDYGEGDYVVTDFNDIGLMFTSYEEEGIDELQLSYNLDKERYEVYANGELVATDHKTPEEFIEDLTYADFDSMMSYAHDFVRPDEDDEPELVKVPFPLTTRDKKLLKRLNEENHYPSTTLHLYDILREKLDELDAEYSFKNPDWDE